MSHLIELAFKGNRKEFYRWDGDDPPRLRAPLIVEGDRGEDLGTVHATGEAALKRFAGVAHGAPLVGAAAQVTRRALRLATAEEVVRAAELPARDEEARRKVQERVRAHALQMKITDAEWQWDRRKLTVYFTAEKRVDFRALVRDLAAQFRARIELKQIGVRDEAKRLSGIGRCGREYCSAAWLPELRPVNLNVAKDQRLSLNPTQISGACGRLMCSLRYEHDFYVQQRKRFPKEGKVLQTARGEEKVVANDIFRERVTLRAFDGESRVVPLAELRAELAALDEGALATAADVAPRDDAPVDDAALDTAVDEPPRAPAPRAPEPVPTVASLVTAGAPPAPPAPPIDADVGRAAPGAPAPVVRDVPPPDAADAAGEAADDADDEGDDDAPEGAEATNADGSPRPRRRRGRRGGRRNRGRGGAGTGGAMPDADAPPDATDRPPVSDS